MTTGKHDAVDDFSSDEEINVDKVVETKLAADKIRKDRERKRAQLQKNLDQKLADMHVRIKQAVEAHTKQLAAINSKQVDRLIQAVEARDSVDQLVREKLAELQKAGIRLAEELGAGYAHRLNKARSLPTPVSEQKKRNQDQDPGRQIKKVKFDDASCFT